MSTTIYLVRHAEVENPDGIEYMRMRGFGLSNFGVKQAHKLARMFKRKNIALIYASPLLRTKETANIIADDKVKIRYSRNLLEADYKKWQGIKRNDRRAEDLSAYKKNPVRYSIVLGESLVDIQKRVVEEIYKAAEKNPGKNILFITHAAPIVAAKLFFEKKSLMSFHDCVVNFASVTTITLDDKLNCKGVQYNEYVDQREV